MENTCSLSFTVFGNRSWYLSVVHVWATSVLFREFVRNAILDPTPGPQHQKLHLSKTLGDSHAQALDPEPRKTS